MRQHFLNFLDCSSPNTALNTLNGTDPHASEQERYRDHLSPGSESNFPTSVEIVKSGVERVKSGRNSLQTYGSRFRNDPQTKGGTT